jgi:hypothetical protein
MSGKSNSFLAMLANERFMSDDRPKIPEYDQLLEALRREFGPEGRPDLVTIPRATTTTPR